ncbi:MAG: hypothetical protein IPM20_01090 [Gammaproteobacteria bacterium]|nr:hypothetical protein [Gammaproteobacteria bacterium]
MYGKTALPTPAALVPTQWVAILQKRLRQFGMTELNEEESAAVPASLGAAPRALITGSRPGDVLRGPGIGNGAADQALGFLQVLIPSIE